MSKNNNPHFPRIPPNPGLRGLPAKSKFQVVKEQK